MIALYSINLRIMGRPNVPLLGEATVLTPFYDHGLAAYWVRPLFLLVLVVIVVVALAWFLATDFGLAMRAIFAQTNGFADVTSGVGTIVVGLAAVIIGENILRSRRIGIILAGVVIGSVLYRIAIQFALSLDSIGLEPSDLNLATAVLVALALIIPRLRKTRAAT